jgi:hypothetical protein
VPLTSAFPPQPTNLKPLCGYRIERVESRGSRNGGDTVVFGPSIVKKTLEIDHNMLADWIHQNLPGITALRTLRSGQQWPTLLVVLSEWVSNSWAHIPWAYSDPGPTTIVLIQESPVAAPQWNYLGVHDKSLNITQMTGNLTVFPPDSN